MADQVKFNLEITMPRRWVTKFLQMLDCMRWCGNVGASRVVAFYADGDGDFRPFNFKVNGKEVSKTEDWGKHDKDWSPKPENVDCDPPKEFPPAYKTRRKVNFFFDAG